MTDLRCHPVSNARCCALTSVLSSSKVVIFSRTASVASWVEEPTCSSSRRTSPTATSSSCVEGGTATAATATSCTLILTLLPPPIRRAKRIVNGFVGERAIPDLLQLALLHVDVAAGGVLLGTLSGITKNLFLEHVALSGCLIVLLVRCTCNIGICGDVKLLGLGFTLVALLEELKGHCLWTGQRHWGGSSSGNRDVRICS
mmetsp:Transcript_27595/g.79629  ORF Transcript_27595/g.79629 Transcript_27595/m.79629 type:complete len:201 (+) Transcript_27595:333-935(+)